MKFHSDTHPCPLPQMFSMALNFNTRTAPKLSTLVITLLCLVASTSAQSDNVLRVLVPEKPIFTAFVECSNNGSYVRGFSIDVFRSAINILIPKPNWTDVKYTCFEIGDQTYDNLITALHSEPLDAVVGDVTISANRTRNTSFTQAYLDSGIVIVTLAEGVSPSFGMFFAPFTIDAWVVIIVSIVSTGLAVWLIERNDPLYLQRTESGSELQRTESRSETVKEVFWFVTSVLVFFKRESIKNPLAKFVMMAWILFILLLGSSYTASFSSILTVNELSPESLSIEDLFKKNSTVGYQVGSIVLDYLKERNITKRVELYNIDEYAKALQTKRVTAIVDEIPYISLFLAAQSASNCKFVVSSKLTIEGLGFAFLDKNLSDAFSVAILNLSESGQMQKIQDGWKLSNYQCPSRVQSTSLDFKNSLALFVFLGSAFVLIVLLKHLIMLPCWAQIYARLRANRRADAIDALGAPTYSGSFTMWFSARHSFDRS